MILLSQGLKIHAENGIRSGALPAGGLDGAVKNGLIFIGDHQVLVRDKLEAQTGTAGTGSGGVVEGEHPGFQFRQADAAVLAGVILRKAQFLLLAGDGNGHKTAGVNAGGFDGVGETAADALFQDQPVHDQLNGMLLVLLGLDLLGQIVLNAVQAHPGKALLPGILKYLLVLALFPPDHRRKNEEAGSLPQGLHPVHDLIDGLAADLLAALGAMRNAGPGPEQTQIVINFRNRAHGGAGAFGGGLLVDGDGRGQPVNGVHIRLIHLSQELPGIGAEALHIPALALGINRVKGKAGFAGTAQTGKHHQLVSGNGEIHVFQVVFPGALDPDRIVHSNFSCL